MRDGYDQFLKLSFDAFRGPLFYERAATFIDRGEERRVVPQELAHDLPVGPKLGHSCSILFS
ncbi:MAG: hypothetical protein ABIV48_03725, partial [Pyrinomonadaceae bacterium]